MSDEPYKTSFAEMQILIDRAGQIEQAIEDKLAQIEKRIAYMHIDWKGQAATAHADAHQRWLKAARDMHEDLKAMRGETRKAHKIYTAVVEHHQEMWPKK
jgi:WXG100 family type VII secretion target